MEILHHGGGQGVTGSCHQLLASDDFSLLVDCGLFQGNDASAAAGQDRHAIDFDLAGVRALVVTHVHIDHVGRIPYLLAAGYKGPILCSEPSAVLLPTVLEDAFRLGISRDQYSVERYLRLVEERLIALPYGTWFTLRDSAALKVRLRLQRAGHILGSAYVEVDVQRAGQASRRVVFSGDLGADQAPLLPAPKAPRRADLLVLESTYGDRLHASRGDRRERLQAAIERALADQGSVLIPAFSIGRTQELLYELEDILHLQRRFHEARQADGTDWPGLPIILDSPLASRFTASYRQLQRFWDVEAHRRLREGRHPLAFDQLITVDDHDEHWRMVNHLARTARPAVVIAGGGMCSGGRIVNYLRVMLGDPRHNVLFVGYQAEGTPGQAIQRFGPEGGYVDLFGERIAIRAGVETLTGYSAHADQRGLVGFVNGIPAWPGQIRLVHGEPAAKARLRDALIAARDRKGASGEVLIPG